MLIFEEVKACLPDRVENGLWIKVEDGRITKISQRPIKGWWGYRRIRAKGKLLLPGFVDLHSDAIEKEVEPRPGVRIPTDIALFELDKKLASCGITHIFHSISFADRELGLRSNAEARKLVEDINRLRSKLLIKHMVHARLEVSNLEAIPILEKLVEEGKVHLLSIMDHTPGQGQFKELSSYVNYMHRVYRRDYREIEEHLEYKLSVKERAWKEVVSFVKKLVDKGMVVASHDDDSPEKVKAMKRIGVSISEFPTDLQTAEAAINHNMHVCVGAPNVLRGGSQGNNMSAREAISRGYASIICSDYIPSSILYSVFLLGRSSDLSHVVKLVSLNPARAVGLNEVGSIEEGKEASLILLDEKDGLVKLISCYVEGSQVLNVKYGNSHAPI